MRLPRCTRKLAKILACLNVCSFGGFELRFLNMRWYAVGLARCGYGYCKLRCSIKVEMLHGHVIYLFIYYF